jgi:hypothetical protein
MIKVTSTISWYRIKLLPPYYGDEEMMFDGVMGATVGDSSSVPSPIFVV